MKCPKCGYNSFEYLDSCKKCNNDLVKFKESLGIRAVNIPLRSPAEVPSPDTEELADDGVSDQDAGEMFVFDPTPPETVHSATAEDVLYGQDQDFSAGKKEAKTEQFSFNKAVEPDPPAEPPKAMEDAFGDFTFQEIANKAEQQPVQAGSADKSPTDEVFADLHEADTASGSPGEEEWAATANEFNPDEFQQFEEEATLEETEADAGSEPAALVGEFELDDFLRKQEASAADSASVTAPNQEPSKDEFDSLFSDSAPLREVKRA